MGVDGAASGAVMRHDVGPRGMDGDAIGDRRAPGGIGAGIEIALEIHGRERPVACGRHARTHAGGMALGG